jgi:hypothetical protein
MRKSDKSDLRPEFRAGFLFGSSGAVRGEAAAGRPQGPPLRSTIPAIVSFIDAHCYLRSFAAHLAVFAREFLGRKSLLFTMSHIWTAPIRGVAVSQAAKPRCSASARAAWLRNRS